MSSILAGLFMAGFFLTLDKTGIREWYEVRKRSYMPNICEHCLTFWYSFTAHLVIYNEFFSLKIIILSFFMGIASTSINYVIRK